MKIILDLNDPPEEDPEELLARAEESLRDARRDRQAFRRETNRLRKLHRRGLLRPTLSDEERDRMRRAFADRGGKVTRCDPATAKGASTSPYWNVDKRALVPGVREIDLTQLPDGSYAAVEGEEDVE